MVIPRSYKARFEALETTGKLRFNQENCNLMRFIRMFFDFKNKKYWDTLMFSMSYVLAVHI